MTIQEVKALLDTTTYSVAYGYFNKEAEPSFPFITFEQVGTSNFGADSKVYQEVDKYEVHLWTNTKDLTAEGKVETALANLKWDKESSYQEGEYIYRTVYSFSTIK